MKELEVNVYKGIGNYFHKRLWKTLRSSEYPSMFIRPLKGILIPENKLPEVDRIKLHITDNATASFNIGNYNRQGIQIQHQRHDLLYLNIEGVSISRHEAEEFSHDLGFESYYQFFDFIKSNMDTSRIPSLQWTLIKFDHRFINNLKR